MSTDPDDHGDADADAYADHDADADHDDNSGEGEGDDGDGDGGDGGEGDGDDDRADAVDDAGIPLRAGSGLLDESTARAVTVEVMVDASLGPGELALSSGAARAMALVGRARAWANVRADAPALPPLSPEEKLLRAIFGEKATPETVELIESDEVVRGAQLIRTPADGAVYFWPAESATIMARTREPTKMGERIVMELAWSPPIEKGDAIEILDAGADGFGWLGLVAHFDEGEAMRVRVAPASAVSTQAPTRATIRLRTPPMRERSVARSIGPYSLLHGRPRSPCATIATEHVQALVRRGAHGLVDEAACRSAGSIVGARVYEAIIKDGDVEQSAEGDVPPTLAITYLQRVAQVLGFDIDATGDGFALLPHNIGACPAGSSPPPPPAPPPEASPASVEPASSSGARDIFSFFEKPKQAVARAERPAFVGDWSHGEVTKPETISYRTLRPERDGLFCERIFGPERDYECRCGKYKRMKYRGIVCEKCGVEVIASRVRGERLGHIALGVLIVPWPYRAHLGRLLGEAPGDVIRSMWTDGGAALAARLAALPQSGPLAPRDILWRVVPVLPPALRPVIPLPGGRVTTSDLNDLYRRVINRNNRLRRLLALNAPTLIIQNEHAELQRAVDALLANGEQRRPVRAPPSAGQRARALVDVRGLFAVALGGGEHGVDYAGVTAVIVDDSVAAGAVAIPEHFARELWKPWLYHHLEATGHVATIKSAKRMVEAGGAVVDELVGEHVVGARVLLTGNRGTIAAAVVARHHPEPVFRIGRDLARALDAGTGDSLTLHLALTQRGRDDLARLAGALPVDPGDVGGGVGAGANSEGWMRDAADATCTKLASLALTVPRDGTSSIARLLLARGF